MKELEEKVVVHTDELSMQKGRKERLEQTVARKQTALTNAQKTHAQLKAKEEQKERELAAAKGATTAADVKVKNAEAELAEEEAKVCTLYCRIQIVSVMLFFSRSSSFSNRC